ncbi:DUF4019 domain-containing protein [Massilia sp. TS11]|uniref:DUF4019 domain-containing protein n=1 Tax=Massilia sp. TS11 TaxID=2908003 RepID=UPI001EDA1AD9|nr:DUF4019 domain-containing protein [Massilia sp. TS11]MCG2584285.1 DUF4019 domain-containing protein [Massilia sp. TS11]
MKRTLIAAALAAALALPCAAADSDAAAPARAAASAFLSLLDSAKFGEAWESSAKPVHSAVSRDGFIAGLQQLKAQMPPLKARVPESATPAKNLPGAPEGDYLVLVNRLDFEGGASAREQLTIMKEADGAWRVVGYFVR